MTIAVSRGGVLEADWRAQCCRGDQPQCRLLPAMGTARWRYLSLMSGALMSLESQLIRGGRFHRGGWAGRHRLMLGQLPSRIAALSISGHDPRRSGPFQSRANSPHGREEPSRRLSANWRQRTPSRRPCRSAPGAGAGSRSTQSRAAAQVRVLAGAVPSPSEEIGAPVLQWGGPVTA